MFLLYKNYFFVFCPRNNFVLCRQNISNYFFSKWFIAFYMIFFKYKLITSKIVKFLYRGLFQPFRARALFFCFVSYFTHAILGYQGIGKSQKIVVWFALFIQISTTSTLFRRTDISELSFPMAKTCLEVQVRCLP